MMRNINDVEEGNDLVAQKWNSVRLFDEINSRMQFGNFINYLNKGSFHNEKFGLKAARWKFEDQKKLERLARL